MSATRGRSASDEEAGEIPEYESRNSGGGRDGSSYASLANLQPPNNPPPSKGESRGGGRSWSSSGRGGRSYGRGDGYGGGRSYNDYRGGRDGYGGRGRGRGHRGRQSGRGRSYSSRSSSVDRNDTYDSGDFSSRGRRNSLEGGGRFHRGGRGRGDLNYALDTPRDTDAEMSSYESRGGRGGRGMSGRGGRYGRGRGRYMEHRNSSGSFTGVSDYASIISSEAPSKRSRPLDTFASMDEAPSSSKRSRDSAGSEGEILPGTKSALDVRGGSSTDRSSVSTPPIQEKESNSQKDTEPRPRKVETSTAVLSTFQAMAGSKPEISTGKAPPPLKPAPSASAREQESSSPAFHDRKENSGRLDDPKEPEPKTFSPPVHDTSIPTTRPNDPDEEMQKSPPDEKMQDTKPSATIPSDQKPPPTNQSSLSSSRADSFRKDSSLERDRPRWAEKPSTESTKDDREKTYASSASTSFVDMAMSSSPRYNGREITTAGRGMGSSGLGSGRDLVGRGGRGRGESFGRHSNSYGRNDPFGGRSEASGRGGYGGRGDVGYRGRGRSGGAGFGGGRSMYGRMGTRTRSDYAMGDSFDSGQGPSYLDDLGTKKHDHPHLTPPVVPLQKVQLRNSTSNKPPPVNMPSYSDLALLSKPPQPEPFKLKPPPRAKTPDPPPSPPTPPPEPKNPSGLLLALTRLATMEQEMEMAYARHMLLKAKQRELRAQYEHMENLPVGIEAIQTELEEIAQTAATTTTSAT